MGSLRVGWCGVVWVAARRIGRGGRLLLAAFYRSISMCSFSLLVVPRIVAFVPFLALSACLYFLSLVLGMLNLPV